MSTEISPEQQQIEQLAAKPFGVRAAGYLRLTGPGFLQSALTLGGGSLAGSLFLGVIGGFSMLWVQLAAIALGAIMLAAIAYVTLSLERSPFDGMRRDVNPFLAWGWWFGALVANMIWALPQYALAYAAITENLLPGIVADPEALGPKLAITIILGLLVTIPTLLYRKGRGARLYENLLKVLVAIIVLAFAGVVVRLTFTGQLAWVQILAGFIPNLGQLNHPAGGFPEALDQIANDEARAWWSARIVDIQRNCMIAAASAAVGINMTFLMPFALLARGWNRKFRELANFDLSVGMVIPFVLATGCVVIASASQFHAQPWRGVEVEANGAYALAPGGNPASFEALKGAISAREQALPGAPLEPAEVRIASMLVPRTNDDLAGALQGLFGQSLISQKVFGVGVLAMALSTISLLMLVSGFNICAATGAPPGGLAYRLCALVPAFGLLWPFLWTGASKAYLAITIGTIGYTLLPLALLSFLFMLNSKRLLGAQAPAGRSRIIWNTLMGAAILITGSASIWTAWNKDLFGFPIGKILLVVAAIGTIAGAVIVRRRHQREDAGMNPGNGAGGAESA